MQSISDPGHAVLHRPHSPRDTSCLGLTATLPTSDFFLISCEHGGNRIPPRYRGFFRGREALLRTHRAYDAGALRMARELSDALAAALIVSVTSRLLIDLNRSQHHRALYSEATRHASAEVREEIYQHCYRPYRSQAEALIAQAVDGGARAIHVSCHSFTPELKGQVRNADIGLLYDPARSSEAELCRRWKKSLKIHVPAMKTRMNYPYAGTADGFTVHLRRQFPAHCYLGIELEINQRHVRGTGAHWRDLRYGIIRALQDAHWMEKYSLPGTGLQPGLYA